jgi:cytosine/adenosine deaminase-related metal-dependent hydrolase
MFTAKTRSPYYQNLRQTIQSLGGMDNAHLHLDRAGTYEDHYFSEANFTLDQNNHISLHKKHALIAKVHSGPAYETEDLEMRVRSVLDTMIELGTRRADTMVDVTADRVGLSALRTLNRVKSDYRGRIELNNASYTPLGFSDAHPAMWETFEEGVAEADFIGALPEADDIVDYPDHIGFVEHCRRVLELARKHNKMIHIHTDQRNDPRETGTEQVIGAVKQFGAPDSEDGEPKVWVIHMVSPSTYDEARFEKLAQGLVEQNIGVICCPSAAVGMRQLRPLETPSYNCIPRVLELLTAGVRVKIASDNIADICSPSTTADLIDELFVLSAAIRFYHVDILAHLAAGKPPTDAHLALIKDHLAQNNNEIQRVIDHYNG